TRDAEFVAGSARLLPLPAGEGRGEGERPSLQGVHEISSLPGQWDASPSPSIPLPLGEGSRNRKLWLLLGRLRPSHRNSQWVLLESQLWAGSDTVRGHEVLRHRRLRLSGCEPRA